MLENQEKQYGWFSVCFILLSSIQPVAFTQTKDWPYCSFLMDSGKDSSLFLPCTGGNINAKNSSSSERGQGPPWRNILCEEVCRSCTAIYTLGDRKANSCGNRIFCHILLFWIESEEKLLAFLLKLLYFQLLARSPRAQRGIRLNTGINKNCCLIGQRWIISTTPTCIHLGCAYLYDMWTNCLTLPQNIVLFTQRKLHNRNLLTHHTTIF